MVEVSLVEGFLTMLGRFRRGIYLIDPGHQMRVLGSGERLCFSTLGVVDLQLFSLVALAQSQF